MFSTLKKLNVIAKVFQRLVNVFEYIKYTQVILRLTRFMVNSKSLWFSIYILIEICIKLTRICFEKISLKVVSLTDVLIF